MSFPKIKGITWISEEFPDIVSIPVTLVDRKIQNLDIEGLEIPEIEVQQFFDISQLAGVRNWYEDDVEEASENMCLVDITGMTDFVANLSKENLIEAWIFYKRFKYSRS